MKLDLWKKNKKMETKYFKSMNLTLTAIYKKNRASENCNKIPLSGVIIFQEKAEKWLKQTLPPAGPPPTPPSF